ncbi:MAG: hypothetical protein ACXABY_02780 [Candidatus Thorarchaeota archaeon]
MTLYDEHNTGSDTNLNLPAGAITRRAMTFQAAASYSCQEFRVKISRVGSPGTITMKIYHTNASGSLLGTATYDGDTITTSVSGEWITFDFGVGSEVTISSGTVYWVLMETPSNGDVSNYVRWRTDTDNGYASGVFYYWFGSWAFTAANDAMFEMYDTVLSPPGKATSPTPADTDIGISTNLTSLDWTIGANAATENVYFGPSGDMALVDTLNNSETFSLADYIPLPYNTAYQWRIDSVNAAGTTTGDTWSFTTLVFAPPAAFNVYKRLVACADGTFWHEDI